jgi:hypothetical protein
MLFSSPKANTIGGVRRVSHSGSDRGVKEPEIPKLQIFCFLHVERAASLFAWCVVLPVPVLGTAVGVASPWYKVPVQVPGTAPRVEGGVSVIKKSNNAQNPFVVQRSLRKLLTP